MNELDLIPSSYRLRLQQIQTLKVFLVLLVSISVICGISYAYLLKVKNGLVADIHLLESKKKIINRQHENLLGLQQSQSNYESQLSLLKTLRSGDEVKNILLAIDKSLVEGEVWFKNWKFQRAGSSIADKPDEKNTGYIIVIPSEQKNGKDRLWKINTHMTIQGQSRDHSALSRFVRRLFYRPEIEDVRVLKTTLRRYTSMNIIDFELAIVVNSHAAK